MQYQPSESQELRVECSKPTSPRAGPSSAPTISITQIRSTDSAPTPAAAAVDAAAERDRDPRRAPNPSPPFSTHTKNQPTPPQRTQLYLKRKLKPVRGPPPEPPPPASIS